MKRILIIGYAALLFAPFVRAQEETPAPPPVEPRVRRTSGHVAIDSS